MALKAFTILAFEEDSMRLLVEYEDDNAQMDVLVLHIVLPAGLTVQDIDDLIIDTYPGPDPIHASRRNITTAIRARLNGTVGVRRVISP